MTRVIILAGGDSDERAVSLRSGAAVQAALQKAGYDVVLLDPSEPTDDYEEQLLAADVIFPVLHGKGGEDGQIQAWLEERGLCYVGADTSVSALCFDKWKYKQKLQTAGIIMPQGQLVDESPFSSSALIKKPFVLKPYDGGSSVDTLIVRNPGSYDQAVIAAAFGRHPTMLLEELIVGTEITVGILLDEALPVIEIIPPSDGEFDYDNKYNGRTQELCPPQHISAEVQSRAQELALRIHKMLGVRDMSRTDMIITDHGKLYVLETNTIPGMTDQSLLPKAASVAGYDMPAMVHMLVNAALQRRA